VRSPDRQRARCLRCERRGPRQTRGRGSGWDASKFRAAVLATAGGRCQRCGRRRRLEAHHKVPLRFGGRTSRATAKRCAATATRRPSARASNGRVEPPRKGAHCSGRRAASGSPSTATSRLGRSAVHPTSTSGARVPGSIPNWRRRSARASALRGLAGPDTVFPTSPDRRRGGADGQRPRSSRDRCSWLPN
jgi:hypothetical protein